MTNRRTLLFGAISTIVLLQLVGCSRPYATIRYRLKITGRVGGKPFEGTTVIECNWIDTRWCSGFDACFDWKTEVRGDAAEIDLGSKGHLFALLGGLYLPDGLDSDPKQQHSFAPNFEMFTYLLPDHGNLAHDHDGTVFDDLAQVEGESMVPRYWWPAFVRFGDITDIKTVQYVDAFNLDQTYGPDSAIETVSVAVTKEPVSRGIEKHLPWWDQVKSGYWAKAFFTDSNHRLMAIKDRPLYADLEAHNFKAEELS